MLSFLREQGNGGLPAQKTDAGTEAAPSDGAEKTQEQEYLTVAAPGKRSLKSTIVLAVFFIIGLLCLGYMIKKSTPSTASAASDPAEESQIEKAIARLTGVKTEMFNGLGEVVDKFYQFSDVLQVKVGELSKDPFELEDGSTDVKEEPRVEINVPEMDAGLAQEQQIRLKARSMKLLSIMQSDRSDKRRCCMIGDKNSSQVLYEGDRIREFRVRQIGDSFVKLEWSPNNSSGSSETKTDSVEVVLNLTD